jgi:hypothetical protein
MAGWWTIEGMRIPGGQLGVIVIEILTMDSNIFNASSTLNATANTKQRRFKNYPYLGLHYATCHLPR